MAEQNIDVPKVEHLELQSVIGFAGNVSDGIILLPDNKHIAFPLGNTIVVRSLVNDGAQRFLQGHNDKVTCLALSPTGRYLASGQQTHPGFQADVIVWDLSTLEVRHRLRIHKVGVQGVAFSPSEEFLATLGGDDDKKLVIWDLNTGKAICGGQAHSEPILKVQFLRHDDRRILTCGKLHVREWEFDQGTNKLHPHDCNLGKLQRTVCSMFIDENDENVYCGTVSGDVLLVALKTRLFKHVGPKQRMSLGITAITRAPSGDLLIGSGDGTIALMRSDNLRLIKHNSIGGGGITTIAPHGSGQLAFVGTSLSCMYVVKYDGLQAELRSTCHSHPINDVAFPYGYSELFATASRNDVRIWNARTCAELLRIQIPSLTCNVVAFGRDGKSVITGWEDGKVRAFGPQTGKLLYVINDAHIGAVTALATCGDPELMMSGGADGCVRVWRVTHHSRVMLASMKEHKAVVNSISVRANDTECVSASSDGSCIVWDLRRFARNNSLFASTFFKTVLYHPDESQLLTAGTDRQITNWDAFDGSAIRIVEGSGSAEVNTLSITRNGNWFVSGGGDKLIKLWNYDDGVVRAAGVGHSGTVLKAAVSPDERTIVSVGEEGAILLWRMPDFAR